MGTLFIFHSLYIKGSSRILDSWILQNQPPFWSCSWQIMPRSITRSPCSQGVPYLLIPKSKLYTVNSAKWAHHSGLIKGMITWWNPPYTFHSLILYSYPKQGVCHIVALPYTINSILMQKKNYGNSNISPCKNIIFKKSSKRNQNPSRSYYL